MTPIAYALAVYHEARRMTRRRAFGPSWSGKPCPSGGSPYGACESCRGYMDRAVAWLLHPDTQGEIGYTLTRPNYLASLAAEEAARRKR